jgi:plastocyanin
MRFYPLSLATLFAAALLSACSGGSSTPTAPIGMRATATPTAAPTAAPTATPIQPGPTPTATAQPQVVRVGFGHSAITDPTFGMVQFYSTGATATSAANVVTVVHGSKIVFTNDSSGVIQHTASGLGSTGFPGSFDNTGGPTATGTTIDSGTTWSSGAMNSGSSSGVFTVGPAGNYFFGCFFHYNDAAMRDVIVSQ